MSATHRVPHVVVLGAGPAGLGAACQLRKRGRARVTVVEQHDAVGGNAGSFTAWGQRLDYGSHRLHPACDPEILDDIGRLLGPDLLNRPRHGRIRLRNRWLHFPLKPADILRRADRRFAMGTLRDMAVRRRETDADREASFASVLRANLGPTICDNFYFPYARKIWGVEPTELSAIQARRRVSAGSFGKLLRKVFAQVPGLRRSGTGRFYYPRHGFGQISDAYADAARRAGAEFLFGRRVVGLTPQAHGDAYAVHMADATGNRTSIAADHVWSTLPISLLARMHDPVPDARVLEAAAAIAYRAMILVYLRLPVDRFTEYDAHYFPDEAVTITRLSEPKNYAAASEPAGQTVLCAELPCTVDDERWRMSDAELAALVGEDLGRAGIPLPVSPTGALTRRLGHAYPIYLRGYEEHFAALDAWVSDRPRMLTFGRQGLFAHDNTHHALAMAYAAVDCFENGEFDDRRWARYRDAFTAHVVED